MSLSGCKHYYFNIRLYLIRLYLIIFDSAFIIIANVLITVPVITMHNKHNGMVLTFNTHIVHLKKRYVGWYKEIWWRIWKNTQLCWITKYLTDVTPLLSNHITRLCLCVFTRLFEHLTAIFLEFTRIILDFRFFLF